MSLPIGIPQGWQECQTCKAYNPPSARVCSKCGNVITQQSAQSLERVFDDAMDVSRERELQMEAAKWLMLNGAGGLVWSGMHKKTTVFCGTADFVFCWRGKYVAAECKIGRNEPRENQVAFLESARKAGGISFVFRSLDELKTRLSEL